MALSVGDTAIVKAAPASVNHRFDKERVIVIGIHWDAKGPDDPKAEPCITFQHPSLGFGCQYERGLVPVER